MRSPALRRYLAEDGGIHTWDEITEASGLSENRAMVECKRLEYEGVQLAYHHITLIQCINDPEFSGRTICHYEECGEPLDRDNECGYCDAHRRVAAREKWRGMTINQKRRIIEAAGLPPEASWLLWSEQLDLLECMEGEPA